MKIYAKEILMLTGIDRKSIAKNCSVTSEAVTKWIFTNRIPNHQWQKIIDISHGRITWEMLENLKQEKDTK
jgi:hypothetical protein